MEFDDRMDLARRAVANARLQITLEMRDVSTPVSSCDARYNYLSGRRSPVSEALYALERPRFVATPRFRKPGSGVERR